MSRKQNKTLQVRMNPKLDPRGAWREGRGFRNRADGQRCSDPLPLTSVRRDTHPCCRPRIRLCCSTVWYGDRATHTVRTRDKARTSTHALIFRKLWRFSSSSSPMLLSADPAGAAGVHFIPRKEEEEEDEEEPTDRCGGGSWLQRGITPHLHCPWWPRGGVRLSNFLMTWETF